LEKTTPPSPSLERVTEFSATPVGAYSARVPLLQALATQCGASLLILSLVALVPVAAAGEVDAMAWAWVQGIVAARLGRGLGMETWWLPIHALFVPGLVWMLGLGLPPLYSLGAFFLLASVYWGVSRTRVPLFLSSRAAARAVAGLLPRERSFTFLDLGCGLGGVLACLARTRPAGRYYGIESAPLPFLLSWLRAALGAQACHVTWGDFQNLDLGRYDVVYAYLSPAAMIGLWDKASREMRAGSLLISNSFAVPGVHPTFMVATGARDGSRLLLWRM
jgi:SAM-dependent methyltransferase